jgi:hypothetical protein
MLVLLICLRTPGSEGLFSLCLYVVSVMIIELVIEKTLVVAVF